MLALVPMTERGHFTPPGDISWRIDVRTVTHCLFYHCSSFAEDCGMFVKTRLFLGVHHVPDLEMIPPGIGC